MKLHFDPNQQYQLDAVKSIIDIFDGQPLNQGNFGFSISESGQLFNENGVGNKIVISKEQILGPPGKISAPIKDIWLYPFVKKFRVLLKT